MTAKYPNITVELSDTDGNVFALIGTVNKAMRRAGVDEDDIREFREEVDACTSYDQVIQTIMRTVDVV